jgi:hypothetical protein
MLSCLQRIDTLEQGCFGNLPERGLAIEALVGFLGFLGLLRGFNDRTGTTCMYFSKAHTLIHIYRGQSSRLLNALACSTGAAHATYACLF